jgi:hypothetical protein
MRTILISAVLIGTLVAGAAIEPAQGKGCIKGALVGGLAGHAAGHGVLGAAGGCVTGRAVAKRAARQRAQHTSPTAAKSGELGHPAVSQ